MVFVGLEELWKDKAASILWARLAIIKGTWMLASIATN
jgi:hypothetical protein